MRIKIFISMLICVLAINAFPQKINQHFKRNYLIVLSLDAFRWDYPQLYSTPNLDSLARIGTKAESLIPSFPTKTFPNHYSIATGLYPDHHGIINNIFYHKELDQIYSPSNRKAVENPSFYNGEPAWVTAEKNGIVSGSYYFVGSETPIEQIQPTYWKKYDASIPFSSRADSVISWLQKPDSLRPHFITFYSEEPDATSHASGPKSAETKEIVERLDSLIGDFCRKKNQLPIADSINFIIVSDHGMGPISKDKTVILSSLLPDYWYKTCLGSNPFFLIEPNKLYRDSVFQTLSAQEGIFVWKKSEVPAEYHYGSNPNIPEFVVCAKPEWSVYANEGDAVNGGTHGYTPDFTAMNAIFYGSGPDFKRGFVHRPFKNIELYNLICKLLNIEPAPNDGKLLNVIDLLNKK